jgi:phosphoserine phosphatase
MIASTNQNLLIHVAGPDRPGITHGLMRLISASPHEVIDMGQAVTHGLLSLSIVIRFHNEEDGQGLSLLKDLLFEANTLGLTLTYQLVEKARLEERGPTERFIVSCVSERGLNSNFIHDVAACLSQRKINILRIDKISPHAFTGLEIMTSIPMGLNLDELKSELINLSAAHAVDVAFLKDNVFRRSKRLVVFDMDSTLIQKEVIDELAELAGAGARVRTITERAMNGELDFKASLEERVSTLKGLTRTDLEGVLKRLPMTEGAEDFIKTLKSLGFKVAVISGGFSFFTDALKTKLGLDYAFGNELEFNGAELTGKVTGTVIDAHQKAFLLKFIAQQEGIHLEQVVAIGDGANDLPMLATAGLGIAFHAKDHVRQKAQNHMSHGPMTSILYFLGIPGPGQY